MTDIKTAAQALVDVAALPEIALRDGLMLRGAISDLKAALERDDAMDKLIAGDADQYDAPEWGEPFYGSDEIGKILSYDLPSGWAIRGLWVNYGSFNGCAENLIYRLRANHTFYGTPLFKNAKKPDVDHACRGG